MQMPETPLRVLIADDEPLARENFKLLLRDVAPTAEIVAEAEDGQVALELVEHHRPDAVFLDIQMPMLNGFEAAQALTLSDHLPEIVFTTAFDDFALRAFEVNAVHYLLKPITTEQLRAACERIIERVKIKATLDLQTDISPTAQEEELRRIADYVQRASPEKSTEPPLAALSTKQRGKILVIKLDDVNHISADSGLNYIYTDDGKFLTDYMLDELEARLDRATFMRIHRSHIVQLKKIASIVPYSRSHVVALLSDKSRSELSISRYRLEDLRKRLMW